jgi:hypothetical protein
MPISCSPSDLAAESSCFECGLSEANRSAIRTRLLAVMAGGSTDPQALLTEASAFQNLTLTQLAQIQAYLLCALVNK